MLALLFSSIHVKKKQNWSKVVKRKKNRMYTDIVFVYKYLYGFYIKICSFLLKLSEKRQYTFLVKCFFLKPRNYDKSCILWTADFRRLQNIIQWVDKAQRGHFFFWYQKLFFLTISFSIQILLNPTKYWQFSLLFK